jgi:hypothetical protein
MNCKGICDKGLVDDPYKFQQEGYYAFKAGLSKKQNPYSKTVNLTWAEEQRHPYYLWKSGWVSARYGWRYVQKQKRQLGDYSAWPPKSHKEMRR